MNNFKKVLIFVGGAMIVPVIIGLIKLIVYLASTYFVLEWTIIAILVGLLSGIGIIVMFISGVAMLDYAKSAGWVK